MNDVFISVDNAKDTIKLPIPPSEVSVSTSKNNTSFTSLTEEIAIQGNDALESISFSSFFPSKRYTFNQDNKYLGFGYVNKIRSWKSNNKIIRLIIKNTNINTDVIIDSFDYNLQTVTGDIDFSISFTKYKKAQTKISTISKKGSNSSNSKNRYITANRVNFRKGAGTNYSIIGKFYKGDKVTFISQKGKWCYVEYKKKKGYVHSDYISKVSKSKKHVSATKKYPTIKYGSKGSTVKDAQKKLQKRGYTVYADGFFGKYTKLATQKLQKKNKLKQTGIIDTKTWKILNK